ncbi:hypothetical protein FA15DRAFT_656561 [Coprinopsis marcescibilis]|uniref:MI domain-containing protein n=1 Tax=Coprinopsis marcescibilis TaxID=230819 RepID=A0A5C3KTT4_COPMA|nr:hypothetical protein FA15DRAFT_656561 [Coprinopsis marcescibilis]
MRGKNKPTGPRLPDTLQDQINEQGNLLHVVDLWTATETNDGHYRVGGPKRQVSRKDLRKQERTARKQHKAQYFSQQKSSAHPEESNKRPAEEHSESPRRKRSRNGPGPESGEDLTVQKAIPEVLQTIVKKKPPKKLDDPPKQNLQKTSTKKQLNPVLGMPKSQVEKQEDAYIRSLEKRLGYSRDKPKKKSAEDEDDGLDDLLDFADNLTYSLMNGEVEDDSDEEGEGFSEGSDEELGLGTDVEIDDTDASGDGESEEEESPSEYGDDGEWGGIDSTSETEPSIAAPEQGNKTPSAYIPPHLRKAQAAQAPSEALLKLTRQLKGLLNRMSEQNMSTILDGIEEIYRENTRNDVTSTLTNLILEGVSSHSVLLDSYVVLHAAFVSSLHKLIGIEFAAHFVQQLVTEYEKNYAGVSDPIDSRPNGGDDRGKECSNLIVLLSELYNFQVISSVLMFDIIRALLKGDILEFNVELLLKVFRNSGQQLRTDDPLVLKDIVEIVQEKTSGEEENLSSRTKFMLETLINLKNNKVKKLAEQNQGGAVVERMKKFLNGLSKTRQVDILQVHAHEPLRISLEDLHSAESKGKWWLVGAAWGGDPLVDRQANIQETAAAQKAARQEESDLLKLARKQGMNSDIRRSIFVVLMSSEDYIDACDRLSQLNLTEVQQREIIRVLLHCCGNEKSYNPYYSLIGEHLCKNSHSYKITIQFCLWDFLRDLGESKVGGEALVRNARDEDGFDLKNISRTRMKNLARCYAWWIAKDAVSLVILKPVDFTILKPQTKEFLKDLLTHVFISSQLSTPLISNDLGSLVLTRQRDSVESIFIKASRIDTLAMGIVYFMSEAFRNVKAEEVSNFLAWAVGLAKDTLQTGIGVIPNL